MNKDEPKSLDRDKEIHAQSCIDKFTKANIDDEDLSEAFDG